MVKNYRKATLQALHTDAVDKVVRSQERNVGARWSASAYKQFRKRLNQKGMFNPHSTKIRIL